MRAILLGAKARGFDARLSSGYERCHADVLVTYGLGGSDRLPHALEHTAAGGRLVAFDAGYWERDLPETERKYRVSLDGFHSPQYIMLGDSPGSARWKSARLAMNPGGDAAGPIILAGCGPKSNAVGCDGWSAQMSRKIRKAFPDRELWYRPKPRRPIEPNVLCDGHSGGSIESALRQSSLVVCRHSNVAVDACRMGVPVVCEDGAAAAIYPNYLERSNEQPSESTRIEFLHRLAWWQWSTRECEQDIFWQWLIGILNATSTPAPRSNEQAIPAHGH